MHYIIECDRDYSSIYESVDRELPEDLIEDELRTRAEVQREHNDQIAAVIDEIDQAMEG